MKTGKKALALLVSTAIMLSVFVATISVNTFAEDSGWMYAYSHDETETYIVGCATDISGDVVIPEMLGGKPVTVIDEKAFQNAEEPITSITIPKTVVCFGNHQDIHENRRSFVYLESLKKIIVHKDNEYYSNDKNGVLYNKDKTQLILYPTAAPAKSFTCPDGVVDIFENAFANCYYLEKIVISESVRDVGETWGMFLGCGSLKQFVVDENNTRYSTDKNGILYNKAKSRLVRFPEASSVTDYTTPESVVEIGHYAFAYCFDVKSVNLTNVKFIREEAFSNCSGLDEITVSSKLEEIDYGVMGDNVRCTINYQGTLEQWNKVFIDDGNSIWDVICLGDEKEDGETTTVPVTDKNDADVSETETVTDKDGNVAEVYNDNYSDDYDDYGDADDNGYADTSDDSKSDGKTWKIILIVAVIALVLAVVVVLIIIKDKKSKASYKVPAKTQTKTKEKTLSEDNIPGFVKFMDEKDSGGSYPTPEDDEFVPYVEEEEKETQTSHDEPARIFEDTPTKGVFEVNPAAEAPELTPEESFEDPDAQSDEKTQSFFDFE